MNKDILKPDPLSFGSSEMKFFATTPCGKDIINMVVYNKKLVVATSETVYWLSKEGVFTEILFKHANN